MTLRTLAAVATAALATGAGAAGAWAQDFPDDDAFVAFECGGDPMADPADDAPGATDEHDVVGGSLDPAGLRAFDDDFLYLRLRLDADPVDAGALRPGGWGFEFDLDEDLGGYEVIVFASGADQTVTLSTNEDHDPSSDPADPPDAPPVATYDFADHGRSAPATSALGGDDDRFLDLAVAWDDLEAVGISPLSRIGVWAGSAVDAPPLALDADLACHDGALGEPLLTDSLGDRDPLEDDGGGGGDDDGPRVEGGGGCAASGGGLHRHALLFVAFALLLARRRR